MKLTDKQREALALIRDGKVTNTNTGYGSWRIFGASPSVVGALRKMGLCGTVVVDERNERFALSDSGRQAIA